MTELMRRTANITMQLLRFIRTSDSYRWHFNWAPAYSATMLTFLAMFALHVSRKWPQLIDRSTLMQDLNPVLRMLDNYSYIDNIADQLRDVVRQSSQDLAVGEEPSNGIYNQDEGNAHTVDVDARSFNAGESFIDFEDVDYFLTTGYLENWSFLEQGDQFAKSSMWRHNSAQ
ncbi:hypothetical protein N7474_006880 [Penicillium riverlandense]|uniref:uncharacterized protein n=1 Tax=Penicillium riverlandense TaxID=1903569 RepID=UPI00254755C7|nr:uncharacterized protein N7474_006880 [Penicillium riverlandense]KAJ5815103.1 hypothetical protein N7474_006880 [Penicillium riverlandense]